MQDIFNIVDKYRDLILKTEKELWKIPETGYKEHKTTAYLAKQFESLGYELQFAEGITGFYTVVDTGKKGPEILILAELDAVICPSHEAADKDTGAVHACGHHAQCAALLGIAAALKEKSVLEKLTGRIRLCTVPAEEFLEIEYRSELKKSGKIKYLGGKSEFLSRGYFDNVDMAFMVHSSGEFHSGNDAVGFISKLITYKGVANHSAYAWGGKNALYAATLGINAVNSIRETFKDEDIIRFHPIITEGGAMVNAIPETVKLESQLRGRTYEVIATENEKVNRALIGAALSIGADIEITDIPGYSPLFNDRNLRQIGIDASKYLPEIKLNTELITASGCTDMGDLSSVMPALHAYCGGAQGKNHGNDFIITDPEIACVLSAKWQLAMLILLLENNAERAYNVIENYKPVFASKEEYLNFVDTLNDSGSRITYSDKKAEIRL